MYHNLIYKDVNSALPDLLRKLDRADEVGSRVGRTKEMTHVGITLLNPLDREILIPSRKPNIAAQIAETMWVLAGRADIDWLEHYLPRVRDFSDDGETWRAGYGVRLRHWEGREGIDAVDQIAWVFEHLRKNPASRRAVLSIWDPVIDTEDGKDIPCNDWLSFSSRLGKLDLHVAVRSNDVIWGWSGINQFEWSALLEVMAGLLGLQVGSLHFSTTSFHIYDHHWAKSARIQENAYRVTGVAPSPRFDANTLVSKDIEGLDAQITRWFEIEKDIRAGNMSDEEVDTFSEPMMRSWLRVLQWWWSGDREYLSGLENTRLERATHYSVQPPEREIHTVRTPTQEEPVAYFQVDPPASEFLQHAIRTHNEKHEAYGDSWKRRGEMLGIMANIARKIDRLGGAETADETSADTALDLMVYLAKYKTWLYDSLNDKNTRTGYPDASDFNQSDTPDAANNLLLQVERKMGGDLAYETEATEDFLRSAFNRLETHVTEDHFQAKTNLVMDMLWEAYRLARGRFEALTKPVLCNRMCAPGDEHPGCPVHGDQYRGADVD